MPKRIIEINGMQVPVDDTTGVPLVWPVIVHLFKNNETNLLTDAQIAQAVSHYCQKDFPTSTVRIYRHRYNRGDFTNNKPPRKPNKPLSRMLKDASLTVEQMQRLRASIEMQQSRSDSYDEKAADPDHT